MDKIRINVEKPKKKKKKKETFWASLNEVAKRSKNIYIYIDFLKGTQKNPSCKNLERAWE